VPTKEEAKIARVVWWARFWVGIWAVLTAAIAAALAVIWPQAAVVVQLRVAAAAGDIYLPAWTHWPVLSPRPWHRTTPPQAVHDLRHTPVHLLHGIGWHVHAIEASPAVSAALLVAVVVATRLRRRRRYAANLDDTFADVRGAATLDGDELARELDREQ